MGGQSVRVPFAVSGGALCVFRVAMWIVAERSFVVPVRGLVVATGEISRAST